ncbi:MAG: 2-C-methyl-D-erythritol 4-phosphate cytidylyltransferase [Gammaproteobacteria bacterium]|nr:2-C-methyl-D-erythritol 4-phosphate cytidylyltransferase [Gammaproteobacteria bacterium]
MGGNIPKQYLPLAGRAVIEHTLMRITAHPRIAATVIAISPGDDYWPELASRFQSAALHVTEGGTERCHSVLNALEYLTTLAHEQDWVLVHDAARPCIRAADIERLVHTLLDHPIGGLLGLPLTDTVKRADARDEVLQTVSREGLWRALTPQMFRLGPLREALRDALAADRLVTDEAAAMELAGHRPRMVEGQADNIKITRPGDLALAELYLQLQARE